MVRCPGQDQRFWKPEDIFETNCPACGAAIEFWKDEPKLKCPECKELVVNSRLDLGCAEWCKYAKECIGISVGHDSNILCNRLIEDMKKIFGDDRKRINHALEVLKYAEQIQLVEGGDPLVVKAATILHDIGIHEAQNKHGSTAGNFQEIEGPPIAKEILVKHGIEAGLVEHVCEIIGKHHSAKNIDTTEFRIVWDADCLVNIGEQLENADEGKRKELIDSTFKTQKGQQLATELFVDSQNLEAN
jgi:HD superfamily phosphodiesterase